MKLPIIKSFIASRHFLPIKPKYYYGGKIKESEIDKPCSTH
jgi:hypothetical protein